MLRVASGICGAVCAGMLLLMSVAHEARAQETAQDARKAAAHFYDRPYTQAELGIGMLSLPTTNICLAAPRTCSRGDWSPEGYLVMLYRPDSQFAIGAGATYAWPASSDTPQRTYANLDRSHTRRYLLFDAVARYYALRYDWAEAWLGATVGAVVINDLYENNTENPSAPILGPQGIAIRTEGLSAGLMFGFSWMFQQNWSLEGALRTAWWFLPHEVRCAPTGDCATLSGSVPVFTLGLAVAYRMGL